METPPKRRLASRARVASGTEDLVTKGRLHRPYPRQRLVMHRCVEIQRLVVGKAARPLQSRCQRLASFAKSILDIGYPAQTPYVSQGNRVDNILSVHVRLEWEQT